MTKNQLCGSFKEKLNKQDADMFKLISIGFLIILLTSCVKEKEFSNNNLNSTLWIQTAAEYKANSIQVYQSAMFRLTDLINDKNHTATFEQKEGFEQLPPAIILDVDETVLDNSPYQGKLVKENKKFSADTWNHWVSLKQAKAIPGVVNFLNKAQEMGVTIFYITNRRCTPVDTNPCPQDTETFENLQSVGIKNVSPGNVLLLGEHDDWGRDKTSRREFVAQNYRIIMLFGDNLGDFLADTTETPQERANLINQNIERWGNYWFMLANPTYGGWQGVLDDPKENSLKTY